MITEPFYTAEEEIRQAIIEVLRDGRNYTSFNLKKAVSDNGTNVFGFAEVLDYMIKEGTVRPFTFSPPGSPNMQTYYEATSTL